MSLAIAAFIAIHGIIHLLGFVKGFGLKEISQLSTPIGRVAGIFWLIASVILVVTAILFAFDERGWVLPGLFGAVISSVLVIRAWKDAKAGMVPNIVLFLLIIGSHFTQNFERESERLAEISVSPTAPNPVIQDEDLNDLPGVVQDWLRHSGVRGTRLPDIIEFDQTGEIQLAPGKGFRSIQATQIFQTSSASYVWRARVLMFGLPVVGRDTYLEKKGRTHFRIAGLVPVVDEANSKIVQGSLLRFLGEAVWFPQFYLDSRVSWREGETPNQAIASMKDGEIEVEATFTFDADHRFQEMEAQRFYGGGDEAVLRNWTVKATAWERFNGVEIPSSGVVIWSLPEGEFIFYKWTITNPTFQP